MRLGEILALGSYQGHKNGELMNSLSSRWSSIDPYPYDSESYIYIICLYFYFGVNSSWSQLLHLSSSNRFHWWRFLCDWRLWSNKSKCHWQVKYDDKDLVEIWRTCYWKIWTQCDFRWNQYFSSWRSLRSEDREVFIFKRANYLLRTKSRALRLLRLSRTLLGSHWFL